jgi:hypothetical protein
MAYLGNGIYDLTNVIKASANPQINYEGLYQDAPSNIATSNLFKAMQPGYEYRSESFIDNAIRTGAYDLAGNVPVDFDRRRDFRNYFNNRPLRPTDGITRFENFNPRVGTITPFQPYESPAFLAKQNVNPYFQGIMNQAPIDFGRFEGITEETDIDDDTQDKVEETKTGIETLLGFLQNFNPLNLITGGLQGIQNFSRGLQNTTFGRSKTLADYFDRVAREKNRARFQDKFEKFAKETSGQGATGGEGNFSTPAGKSTSYEEASRAFGRDR